MIPRLRLLTPDDLPRCLEFSRQNRWNQLPEDWQRQLELEPTACFGAEVEGLLVGTACACVFDDVAWINLVLVDSEFRGRGIGTQLLRHVVDILESRGTRLLRLDATPLGQPVYEKLGFRGDFPLARFEGGLSRPSLRNFSAPEPVGLLQALDLPAMEALDTSITHTSRGKLLRWVWEKNPNRAWKFSRNGNLEGFCLVRPGARAWQIGPCLGSAEACRSLFLEACRQLAGEMVFIDIPTQNAEAVGIAQQLGLTIQRPFLRMTRGGRHLEDLDRFWTAFSPEKG